MVSDEVAVMLFAYAKSQKEVLTNNEKKVAIKLIKELKMTKGTDFGEGLIEGLQEAVAWKRGEIALPVRNAPSVTTDQVKAILKAVAKSSKEFSLRFGIPLRTLEGWE